MKRCVAIIGLILTFLPAQRSMAQEKLRVGLSSVSGLHAALWVAEEKGFLRKNGIDPEVIVTGQGGNAGISALLANDIQIVNSAGDVLVAATIQGGDTVMIAGVVNKGLQRLVTKPEIKTPAELKSKRIGVTRVGAISHSVLLMMLQRWKMTVNDVQVMQLGSSPNMIASMDKGGIDGAVLTIPSMFVAEDRGYRVLLDMADTDIYYLHTMVATTRQYIKNNRDKVLRFLRGYVEGIAFVKQNKKESIDIVRKKLRLGPEQTRNLERSLDLLTAKYYETIPYPSLRGVETLLGFVEKDIPKAKTADPKSFVDDSLLREIEQSGFVKTLYAR
jgi:NitT/TauT family transport system substrate-binding protein